MICPGGEKAFFTCIIEDNVMLKHTFRWYTTMLGRKSNLKLLTSKLWEVGATVVKTTEFVQGQTCRWGVTFLSCLRVLERKPSVIHVLQSVEAYFCDGGALLKLNTSSFTVDQTPGTLLVKGSLQQRDGQVSGAFSTIFQTLEEVLKQKFRREK
ncbi:hypothetical protein ACLB2K_041688 [Fragaria x ananassa]